MNLRLSINQIFKLISTNGADKTYIIEGPMGSGKSSITKLFDTTKYHVVTVDCTQLDVGDIQIPSVDRERGVVEYVPNVLFFGDGSKPVAINLDEIGKAPRTVQNALLPILLEHRVGMRRLPAGSVVFGTTNLGVEGVGDLFQAHACNRVSFIEMRNPTAEELIEWGMQNGMHEAVLAWIKEEEKRLLGDFREFDRPDDFPYGFHPKEKRRSIVTPRSLYLASLELREEHRAAINDPDITLAAIAGNIGARAALDLMAFVQLADKLTAWNMIVAKPDTASIPSDNAAAMMMTVWRAVMRTTAETLDPVMTYIKRLPKEMQCVFATQLLRSRKPWAVTNMNFTNWVRDNHWVMK